MVKATLTLADGSKIVLTDSLKGKLADQNGISVTKNKAGQIIYNIGNKNASDTTVQYNTLSTARHEQFQVVLPDGSHVWLNAASSLQYPVSFKGKERTVKLSGEAYFEVTHNAAKPFIVQSRTQQVRVLGTHFDINAYEDESAVRTTLLQGSVKITANSDEAKILVPDQQSINESGRMKILQIDPEAFVAWKNGYFMFDDEDLGSIMRQLARWYDVEVIFSDPHQKRQVFGGSITRFANISEVLRMLQKAGNVHFTVKDKKVLITQ